MSKDNLPTSENLKLTHDGYFQEIFQIKRVGVFEEVVGEKVMSTLVEMWKAEGKAEGEAIGEARGEVLAFLRARFKKVPKATENTIRSMTDLTALKSLAVHAESCQSLEDFAESLK